MKMLLGNLLNDGFCLLSKQLKFYTWQYKRDLDQRQRQELLEILEESHFSKLANKIKALQAVVTDSRQQIGKLLIEKCLASHRRHQLIQLIQSGLVDINVRLDNYGRTLLHRTAYNLDVELVELLIKHDVNLRLLDYAGNTALHIAIQSYRNGALIFNNEPDVVKNLTTMIRLLLDADRQNQLRQERSRSPHGPEANRWFYTNVAERAKIESNFNSPMDSIINMPYGETPNLYKGRRNAMTPKEAKICRLFSYQNSKCRPHCLTDSNRAESGASISPEESVIACSPPNIGSENKCQSQSHPRSEQDTSIDSICHTQPAFEVVAKSGSKTKDSKDMDETSASLIDSRNAFGRTALHYCVSVVGEKHLDHFVGLLLEYGADPDAIDTRLKTPLYCLVKRPGMSLIRPKYLAIKELLENGCDDLGLAMRPESLTAKFLDDMEKSLVSSTRIQHQDEQVEPIFMRRTFKRVPTLKHMARLCLKRQNDLFRGSIKRQMSFSLPIDAPASLNSYINRKILDQSELN